MLASERKRAWPQAVAAVLPVASPLVEAVGEPDEQPEAVAALLESLERMLSLDDADRSLAMDSDREPERERAPAREPAQARAHPRGSKQAAVPIRWCPLTYRFRRQRPWSPGRCLHRCHCSTRRQSRWFRKPQVASQPKQPTSWDVRRAAAHW